MHSPQENELKQSQVLTRNLEIERQEVGTRLVINHATLANLPEEYAGLTGRMFHLNSATGAIDLALDTSSQRELSRRSFALAAAHHHSTQDIQIRTTLTVFSGSLVLLSEDLDEHFLQSVRGALYNIRAASRDITVDMIRFHGGKGRYQPLVSATREQIRTYVQALEPDLIFQDSSQKVRENHAN